MLGEGGLGCWGGAQGLGGRPDMLAARPAAGPAAEHPSSSVRQSSSYPTLRRASRGNNIDLRSTFGSSLKGGQFGDGQWSYVVDILNLVRKGQQRCVRWLPLL